MSEITPETYICYGNTMPIIINSHLSDELWKSAPWTGLVVDIEGDA